MENSRPTQAQRVLGYMENCGSITQLEAWKEIGVMRLASRISELRKNGCKITSKMIKVNNRYGETCSVKRYTLAKEDDGNV